MSSGLSIGMIGSLSSAQESAESKLMTQLNGMTEDATMADLVNLQVGAAKWNLMTQTVSTITKEIGDAMKGVVNKAG